MIEHVVIDAFIKARCIGDTELFGLQQRRVFKKRAPQIDPDDPQGKPPVYPLTVFNHISSHDSLGAGSVRIQTDHRYRFVVWVEKGIERAIPIANRIDALFTFNTPVNFTLGVNTYTVLGSVRESQNDDVYDIEGGKTYSCLAADYRIYMDVP